MNEILSGGAKLVNLDHATFPIKDMQLLEPSGLEEKIRTYIDEFYFIKPHFATTASDFTLDSTAHHYKISKDQVLVTGLPKTDYLSRLTRQENSSSQRILFFQL